MNGGSLTAARASTQQGYGRSNKLHEGISEGHAGSEMLDFVDDITDPHTPEFRCQRVKQLSDKDAAGNGQQEVP